VTHSLRSSELSSLIAASGLDATGAGAPGSDPAYRFEAERTIEAMASTLARLHGTPVPEQLRRNPAVVVAPAALVAAADAGTGQPGVAYRHLSRDRLVEILRSGTPADPAPEQLVLCHGRPTFGRLRFDGPTPLGFDDWSAAGLADPHLDLAAAARDLVARFGPAPIHAFFEHYASHRPDPVRLDWYLLAAELS
jgi:aminoglycoside phosphotransferase